MIRTSVHATALRTEELFASLARDDPHDAPDLRAMIEALQDAITYQGLVPLFRVEDLSILIERRRLDGTGANGPNGNGNGTRNGLTPAALQGALDELEAMG